MAGEGDEGRGVLTPGHVDRLDALGFIASSVAHEFNNLMQVVLSNLDVIAQRVGGGAEPAVLRSLGRAVAASEHATKLTRQMLNFSRKDRASCRAECVNDLVRGLDALLKPAVGSRVRLSFDLYPGLLPVLVDQGQFDLALLNLARNAVDAMPCGGRLVVSTEPGDGVACVTVADTGDGMSAALVQAAAEPFFTTKPAGQGTGLGLSMVQDFVHQARGTLHIDSTPGVGTKVRLCLPLDRGIVPSAGLEVAG